MITILLTIGGIALTESTLAAAITAFGGVLVGLLALFGTTITVIASRAKKSVEQTHAELVPNHGSSHRDAVDRVESKLDSFVSAQTAFNHVVLHALGINPDGGPRA